MIQLHPSSQNVTQTTANLHFIEELQAYMKPGCFLNTCSSQELEQVACNIYQAFASQRAATMAMHRSSEAVTTFFEQYILPLDYDFPLPANIEPGGNLDHNDGFAFEHARQHLTHNQPTVPPEIVLVMKPCTIKSFSFMMAWTTLNFRKAYMKETWGTHWK
jgi:hypothetical protein